MFHVTQMSPCLSPAISGIGKLNYLSQVPTETLKELIFLSRSNMRQVLWQKSITRKSGLEVYVKEETIAQNG